MSEIKMRRASLVFRTAMTVIINKTIFEMISYAATNSDADPLVLPESRRSAE